MLDICIFFLVAVNFRNLDMKNERWNWWNSRGFCWGFVPECNPLCADCDRLMTLLVTPCL
jgi:hypothetical protein